MSPRFISAIGFLLCASTAMGADLWTVQTVPTRNAANGQPVTVAIAVPKEAGTAANAPVVRHVLLYPQSGRAQLKAASGSTALALNGIWTRLMPQLQAFGVVVVYLDAPSDADHRGISNRLSAELRKDISAAAKEVQKMFPTAQLHLAGLSVVAPLLDAVNDLDGIGRVVLAASTLRDSRTSDWSGLRKPVLMLQAPSATCDTAAYPEVALLAQRSHFTLVQVGYERQETKADCSRTSQHEMYGQEAAVAQTVADWLDGKAVPAVIGYPAPQVAWREEVISYQAPSTFGTNKLEATLLLPDVQKHGAGPYPVMVWNHGDIEVDATPMRYKSRVREILVAREFLQMGVAVLTPARRGVGLSEGVYPKFSTVQDSDATYKARVHAQDIMPALAWLKTRAELDTTRIVISGQSAGGYSAMYIASQNVAGIVGAVDFSGGRTDKAGTGTAGFLNPMMVNGFAEFGATTRIPTLWVFAENDSRYTVNTILACHEAFQKAGGKARLLLTPPIEGDGHHVYHKPDLWRAALFEYLTEIGVVRAQQTQ